MEVQTSMHKVPGVWVSADHQCIVWCNQLVSLLGRMLLSWVDATAGTIPTVMENGSTSSVDEMRAPRQILRGHLIGSGVGEVDGKQRSMLRKCQGPSVVDACRPTGEGSAMAGVTWMDVRTPLQLGPGDLKVLSKQLNCSCGGTF